jgi:hypothetical protein
MYNLRSPVEIHPSRTLTHGGYSITALQFTETFYVVSFISSGLYQHVVIVFMSTGVRLSLWTAPTNRLSVHPPDDTSMKLRWNDTERGNPKNSEKNLSEWHFVLHTSRMDWPGRESGPRCAVGALTVWAMTPSRSIRKQVVWRFKAQCSN